jgi:hypothetical protein
MRGIIQNQESHTFIEGPIQSKFVSSNSQEGSADKAAYHADLTKGYELDGDDNADIYNVEKPFSEANERYD